MNCSLPKDSSHSNSTNVQNGIPVLPTSGSNISLTHWTLRDAAGHVSRFARYTLGAHSYVKIRTGHGSPTQTNRYWNRSWYIWNNTGDTATLKDNHGGKVDSCRYTGTSAGYVFG
jgi:Lamin Tail Domain